MKYIIAFIGAFFFAGLLITPERSYKRPASAWAAWGLDAPSFAIWSFEVRV